MNPSQPLDGYAQASPGLSGAPAQWQEVTGGMRVDGSSVRGAVAVTPNDASNLDGGATRGLYLGVAGDLKVTMADGTVVTFANLAAGVVHSLAVKRVWSTGSDGGLDVLALY